MGPFAQLARVATAAAMQRAIGTPSSLTLVVMNRAWEAERGVYQEQHATIAAVEVIFLSRVITASEPNPNPLLRV